MTKLTPAAKEVLADIKALKKIGIILPSGVAKYVKQNPKEIQEYYDGGMKISEITDHVKIWYRVNLN